MKNGETGSEKSVQNKDFLKEPVVYEEEYFYKIKRNKPSFILGFILIGFGIFSGLYSDKSLHIPFVAFITGSIFLYAGFRGFQDKTPQLKFSKKGIWSKKTGFADWNDIFKAQVVEETNGRSTQTFLDIYFKANVFAIGNQPDERINITNIEGHEYMEMEIHTLMSKRSELKS